MRLAQGCQDFPGYEISNQPDEICFAERIFFRVPEHPLREVPESAAGLDCCAATRLGRTVIAFKGMNPGSN
jgi:hypothetical protein